MVRKVQALLQHVESGTALRRKARAALRNPGKALAYVRRIGSQKWIKALFNDEAEYRRITAELVETGLLQSLHEKLAGRFEHVHGTTVRGNPYTPGAMLTSEAAVLYAVIRKHVPRILVETGVCNGFSSAVILSALERNGVGRLYSIDYPEFAGIRNPVQDFWMGKGGAVVPSGETSGWIVPESLRGRWDLRLGKSSELLPALLRELGRIDFFVHDSEHSFENQLFEFRLAFDHLNTNGLIAASDINWSDAFNVFSKEISGNAKHFFVNHSLAWVIRKGQPC